jgi:hypothetical protein
MIGLASEASSASNSRTLRCNNCQRRELAKRIALGVAAWGISATDIYGIGPVRRWSSFAIPGR